MTAAANEIDLGKTPFAANPAWAVVVGCGDIGMASARALGRRHPLLIVDVNAEALDKAVAALRHEGHAVAGHVCDITDAGQLHALGEFLSQGPGVKVLTHVAAISRTDWKTKFDVNLLGVHRVARTIGPHIVPGGVAVLVSSAGAYMCPRNAELEALIDDPFVPDFHDKLVEAYGHEPDFREVTWIAKQGVNRLAQRLALEWGPRQVRVVSVSPGMINTSMGRATPMMPIWDGGDPSRLVTRDEKAKIETPLGRQATIPEVIAVIDFLASDAASFVTGIDVPIDGGSILFWRKTGATDR